MYNLRLTYFYIIIFSLFAVSEKSIANDEALLKQYDETVFVISNFSGVDANLIETRSIDELLKENIGGFRFYLEWEKHENRLMIKKADGTSVSFSETLRKINDYLNQRPDRVFNLFLDFSTNVFELADLFHDEGLINRLYILQQKDEWPTIKKMVDENRRLVIFSMQEHRNSPEWLHYIWNHAVEPYFSIIEAPIFKSEFLKGDPKNNLLIYNDYNFQGKPETSKNLKYDTTQNPYLIEHIKNTWRKTGKTPNFIMLDRYDNWIRGILNYLRSFRTIKGTVTFNTEILDYVNWSQSESLTSGKYCFPVGPGDKLYLSPRCPGFRFTPDNITFNEPEQNIIQHFIGTRLEITDNLEGHFTFTKESKDFSVNGFNGKPNNVKFSNDSIRTSVAHFTNNSYIILPGAENLKIRDHDFTVAAWIKIAEYLPNKRDYCILGTKSNTYQQGIHLLIRDKKPYFGFYSNDTQGKTELEAGQWYHLVWRYNKISGEQAIFINGKLDSRSLGHPAYKGRDNLYIGIAGFNWSSNMNGAIDDVSIWSRALGEEEIWQLSREVIEIVPIKNLFIVYPVLSRIIISIIALFLISLSLFKLKKYLRKKETTADKIRAIEQTVFQKPELNAIQLFGDFKVINKDGRDISSQFTPKLKQLFLIIMLYSQRNKNGISTGELTEMLWHGHSAQSAKNSRGVTIRKLRLILESLNKVEINFNIDRWSMSFGGNVYCDYIECLKLLKGKKIHDTDFNLNFYHIIQEGELFKGESYDWLDDFKGFIGNNIVDILLKFINELDLEIDHDLIIKLADRILISDPVNDQALAFKLKILIKQNNYNLARYNYDRFCILYEEMYGEKHYSKFEDLIS